jgi:hypothetical protein
MPRRRANTEGSIYWNDTRDRWEAKYVSGRGPNGALTRRVLTAPTRKAVAEKLRAALDALEQGLTPPDDRVTIADFAAWWSDHVLPSEGLAPGSEKWCRDYLRLYVLPHVGARALTGPRALPSAMWRP